jgi:hypothetical protein
VYRAFVGVARGITHTKHTAFHQDHLWLRTKPGGQEAGKNEEDEGWKRAWHIIHVFKSIAAVIVPKKGVHPKFPTLTTPNDP